MDNNKAAPQQHAQAALSDGLLLDELVEAARECTGSMLLADAFRLRTRIATILASHQPVAAPADCDAFPDARVAELRDGDCLACLGSGDEHGGFSCAACSGSGKVQQGGELPQDERAAFSDTYKTGIKPWSQRIPPGSAGNVIADAMQDELNELRRIAAQRAASVPAQPLTLMSEDGDEWYFDCDGHYIDVKRDKEGKYSVYFRNRKDGSEAYSDQADIASVPAFVPAGYANETEFLRQQLTDARRTIKAHEAVLAEVKAASVPDAVRKPVAYAHPKVFQNFERARKFGVDGVYEREWMWAKPDAGLVPLYTAPPVLTDAAADVLAERQRQTNVENWTAAQDDKYTAHELLSAACCYAMCHRLDPETLPANWPWNASWWKPTTQRRNLIKATALILAEIERLDRAAAPQTTEKP